LAALLSEEMVAQMPIEFLRNYIIDLLKVRFTSDRFLRSLMVSLYLTRKCNLKCSYCVPPTVEVELSTSDIFRILEKVRPHSPALNITGGEPLVRADIVEVLKKAKELEFGPIWVNTNALILERREEVLEHLDYLSVSLDMLDERKWDNILGVGGAAKKIKRNIVKYAQEQEKLNFRMTVHCVITPETISDAPKIIDFCDAHGLKAAFSPQSIEGNPHPELIHNDQYKESIREVIRLKKKGKPAMNSATFLRQIMDFVPHNCYPVMFPRVEANGYVYFPCGPMRKLGGDLLEEKSLYKMMKKLAKTNSIPECRNKCFMSCYMEGTSYVENPYLIFSDLCLQRKVLRK
jgi:MoaA/NifB/PqqE/SkfB family radical SAM enzyme